MSTTDEAARSESLRRYPIEHGEVTLTAAIRNARREAFEKGAAWQRDRIEEEQG